MTEDWTKALWCVFTDDHACAARTPIACQCRQMPPLVYREAVARAMGEPLPKGHPSGARDAG